jgi:glycerol-3-phosphate responsive antiterminator
MTPERHARGQVGTAHWSGAALPSARTFNHPTTRIEWEDVAKVELVPRVTDLGGGISKLVRVVGRRSSTSIVFTGAIENFAELLEMIRNRATHATTTSLPLVWRVLLTR